MCKNADCTRRIFQCTLCLYCTSIKKRVVRHVSQQHTQIIPSTTNATDSNNQSPFKPNKNPGHGSSCADYDNDDAFETSFKEEDGGTIEATPNSKVESNLAEHFHKYVSDSAPGIISKHPSLLRLFHDNEEQDNKLPLFHKEQLIEEQVANETYLSVLLRARGSPSENDTLKSVRECICSR